MTVATLVPRPSASIHQFNQSFLLHLNAHTHARTQTHTLMMSLITIQYNTDQPWSLSYFLLSFAEKKKKS